MVNTTATTQVIVPNDSTTNFNNGSQVHVSRIGTGAVQLSAASGVTLRSADNRLNLRSQYSTATVVKKQMRKLNS